MVRKKIPPPTTERILTEDLLVDLSPAEHTEKSEQLAKLDLEINAKKEAARAEASARREAIKVLVERRDELATIVESHKETRAVECLEVCDFERNTVVLKRRDNGEFVSERAMEGEERAKLAQGEMLNGGGEDEERRPQI